MNAKSFKKPSHYPACSYPRTRELLVFLKVTAAFMYTYIEGGFHLCDKDKVKLVKGNEPEPCYAS